MNLWVKFAISVIIALAGLNMISSSTAELETLWLAIPGALLMIPGVGGAYYYWARIHYPRSKYLSPTEKENEANGFMKENTDGKK